MGETTSAQTEAQVATEANPATGASPSGRNPFEAFSLPARVVIILSIIMLPVGTALVIVSLYDTLPAGSYPIWFFALPVFMIVGGSCLGALVLLSWCGVPLFRPSDPANSHGDVKEIGHVQDFGSGGAEENV